MDVFFYHVEALRAELRRHPLITRRHDDGLVIDGEAVTTRVFILPQFDLVPALQGLGQLRYQFGKILSSG